MKKPLLGRITTVTVSGVQRFVAKDWLKATNVGWTGDNFNILFLNKVEESVPEAKLAVYQLERASLDAPILKEIGGRADVQLAYLFDLFKKQSKGEDGILLTRGRANIFYIRDADGNLWVAIAYWNSGNGYWNVEANSVEDLNRWNDGNQVFSRYCFLSSAFVAEVLLINPFFQPPIIRPRFCTSDSMEMYCLLGQSLFSHKICVKNLIISIFSDAAFSKVIFLSAGV